MNHSRWVIGLDRGALWRVARVTLTFSALAGPLPDHLAGQAPPRHWRIDSVPAVSIGSRDAEGPELFASIPGAMRLSNGTIVVADAGSLQLRLFSSAGKHIRTVGRRGGGPGEFQSLSQVLPCGGDSVFIYDPARMRLSVFAPGLDYVRSTDIRTWSPTGYSPYDVWCHPRRTIAFVHRNDQTPVSEGPLRHLVEVTFARSNDSVVKLGQFPASEMYFRPPAAGPRHLGRKTSIAIASNAVYVGTADDYEISRYSLQGRKIGTVREARDPVKVTANLIAAYVDDYVVHHPKRSPATMRQYFSELKWPDIFPAYGRLLADKGDNLWVEDFPIPGKSNRGWAVFGPDGRRLATVNLPAGFRLLEAGENYVMGVWRDELDVEYLRIYGMKK